MTFSSRVVILSIALVCGLGGNAMSQTEKPAALPNVVVEAPKHAASTERSMRHAVVHNTVAVRTVPASSALSNSSESPLVQLARYEKTTGNCVDGCQSSFRVGNKPWNGCSTSAGLMSPTCRNVANFKTYEECRSAGLLTGWRGNEVPWYCGSLALK